MIEANFPSIDFQCGGKAIKTIFFALKYMVVKERYEFIYPASKVYNGGEAPKIIHSPFEN